MVKTHRALTLVAAVVVGALLTIAALRGFWVEKRTTPGQFLHGYFEGSLDREVFLTLEERDRADLLPRTHVGHHGLYVPPGRTVGIPLGKGLGYQVRTDAGEMAPYCVFGRETPLGDAGEPKVSRLENGHVITVGERGPALIPWNATSALRDDMARLRALWRRCASGPETEPFSVRMSEDNLLDIRYGQCSALLPVGGAAGPLVMAVVAGVAPALVEKEGGWGTWTSADSIALTRVMALSLFAMTGIALALGWTAALVAAFVMALASVVVPGEAGSRSVEPAMLLCLVLAVPASLVAGLYRVVARRARRRSSLVQIVALLGLSLILGAAAVLASKPGEPRFSSKDWRAKGERPSCVLTGYSMAKNETLRDREGGTWGRLVESCCPGGAARYAASGQTFPFIRDLLCSRDSPLTPGQDVVFLGGINDDLLYEINRKSPGRVLASLLPGLFGIEGLATSLRAPTFEHLRDLERILARDVLRHFDDQEAILQDGLRCARERGLRVVFLHDFLITDLLAGSSPERVEMLQRRRRVVEESKGIFVGLFEQVSDRVGVAWFNDYCHFSEVGHEQVADLACSLVGGSD